MSLCPFYWLIPADYDRRALGNVMALGDVLPLVLLIGAGREKWPELQPGLAECRADCREHRTLSPWRRFHPQIFLSVLHFVGSLLSMDHHSELDAPHYLLLNLAPDKGPSDQTSAEFIPPLLTWVTLWPRWDAQSIDPPTFSLLPASPWLHFPPDQALVPHQHRLQSLAKFLPTLSHFSSISYLPRNPQPG